MSNPVPRRLCWEIVYPPPGPKRWIDPNTGWRMKRTDYRFLVPVENSEEEGDLKKKWLKEASKSDSNTLPPDYTSPNQETETDLDSTARCEAKPKELESSFTNNVNNVNANGNGNGANGGNHEGCTYKKFLACKLRDFDGKGGAIALTRWIEKMKSVRGREAALGMTWEDFKALLMEEFCPRSEMEKLETEFWNHAMVGANHAAYTIGFMSWLN
ncbi:hypothetical protein Tco_0821110 [Tanacetum coccineum]|uniref:Retrotransposon gag domain-containing protein n=1 Tax=Tanacetum coccineum TaxID=301880 RepID=A0ABQ5AFJ7_9ASTR